MSPFQQPAGRGGKPPIGIAFEGDLGQRIDAVLAVALLNGLAAKGGARSIALCLSRTSLKAAQFADVVEGFYAPRPAGGTSMIGMPEHGPAGTDAAMVEATLSRKTPQGTAAYATNLARVIDTADNAVLIRNMILAQNDGNAALVVAGPATGLARLRDLYGARPEIAAKVKVLVLAAGAYPDGGPEASIAADVSAARAILADWPTPVVLVGTEVGAALPYPAAGIESDFGWTSAHPVVDAYRAFKPMPYDAPAPALAAVLYAAQPDQGYFTVSAPGTVTVQDDGRTRFAPAAGGNHRYLTIDPTQKDRVIKTYRELVSAQPAARAGRGGRGA